MKLRNLINDLNRLKVLHGKETYENILDFDFLVRIVKKDNFNVIEETKSIGIYLDDVSDECQIIAYVDKGEKEENVPVN